MHVKRAQESEVTIYKSGLHLAVTFLIVLTPFLALLIFSRFNGIDITPLLFDIAVSAARLSVAYTIAAILALLLALPYPKAKNAFIVLPIFDLLQSFPVYAIMPFAVLYWGSTNFTVIFFLTLIIMWPVLFSVFGSIKRARHDWQEAIQIYDLTGWNYYKLYLWPLCIPGLVSGSIIGIGEGWGALIATETIVDLKGGLGEFFQANSEAGALTFVGILALLIIVFIVNKIIWAPLLEKSNKMMEE